MWSDFNLNDRVRIRITPHGRKCLSHPVTEDKDGWSEWQLWDVMATFGPAIYMGCSVPFETSMQMKVKK